MVLESNNISFEDLQLSSLSGNNPLWIILKNGKQYFVKSDHIKDYCTVGKVDSSIKEIIACRIGQQLGINVIDTSFGFVKLHNKKFKTLVTVTDNFNRNFGCTPMTNIVSSIDKYEINEFISLQNEKVRDKFFKMLLFDFIIGNNDRHTSNIEFVLGPNFNIVDMAPVFDNGNSLGFLDEYKNTPSFKLNTYNINKFMSDIWYMPYQLKYRDLLTLINLEHYESLNLEPINIDKVFEGLEFLDNYFMLKYLTKIVIDSRIEILKNRLNRR